MWRHREINGRTERLTETNRDLQSWQRLINWHLTLMTGRLKGDQVDKQSDRSRQTNSQKKISRTNIIEPLKSHAVKNPFSFLSSSSCPIHFCYLKFWTVRFDEMRFSSYYLKTISLMMIRAEIDMGDLISWLLFFFLLFLSFPFLRSHFSLVCYLMLKYKCWLLKSFKFVIADCWVVDC